MKIRTTEILPNDIKLSIVEVDNPIAIMHFDNRFQVVVVMKNKKIFPMLKKKFLNFEESYYIYSIKSDKTNNDIWVDDVLYNEKQMCDRSLEDCTTELLRYISMYNQGIDLKKELKKTFRI